MTYQCFGENCMPDSLEETTPKSQPKLTPVATRSNDREVGSAHVQKDAKGRSAVELDLRLDPRTLLRFHAWPSVREGLKLKLVRPHGEPEQEESAWSRPAHADGTGGLNAPAKGWPDWKATASMATAVPSPVLDGPALFNVLSPSVFKVVVSTSTGTQQGSAVAISKSELLTNCHVLQGAQKIVLKQTKQKREASLLAAEPAADRCMFSERSLADAGARRACIARLTSW